MVLETLKYWEYGTFKLLYFDKHAVQDLIVLTNLQLFYDTQMFMYYVGHLM